MTDKELARLNRNDLLQLLIDQVREADGLRLPLEVQKLLRPALGKLPAAA